MDYTGAPFLGVKDACKVTGLSQKYLRAGCSSGEIPHIMVGTKYMINIPKLLKKLDNDSVREKKDGMFM